ncbi:MAG: alpha/beta hydrolase [Promethearchaeota archaeon]|nr:MAG: alpha/beta hydrolase [Candidatus Lokiarchaeota archaeon]
MLEKEEQLEIPPDLAKLIAIKNSMNEKALEEFTEKKSREGISVSEALKNNDFKQIIELSRYQTKYIALNMYGPLPGNVKCELTDADGVAAEWITNPNVVTDQILFHLFGGGYVMGTLETRRRNPFLLGRESKLRCLNIGYRLAPEHPFPAALDDSIKAYRWLLSAGVAPENIVFSGASAGGGLAIATLLKLRELGVPLPAAAVLLSPWVDLALTGDSLKTNAKFEPNITKGMLRGCAMAYLRGKEPKNPLASPLYADLKGLPPMLIHAGSIEVLLDDSVRLAEHAKASGVEVNLEVWEGMTHVFQSYGDSLTDSRQAIENIGKFIQKTLRQE